MRLLLLVDCYYPSVKSSAKLMHDLAADFHSRSNQVIVLTPCDSVKDEMVVSNEDGVMVARVRTRKIKGAGKISRAFEEARLSATVWNKAKDFLRRNPCDVIIFYSPTIFWGGLVRKLKALWDCPAYLILRDIFPEWAVNAGVLRKGLVYRFFRSKEIQQYETADLIGVQSPANLDYFARNFPSRRYPVEVLYNWTALAEHDLPVTGYRQALGLQDKVVFVYGGNLGVAQDVDNILRLAQRTTVNANIHFLLVGEGSETARLKKSIIEKGLPNIRVLPAMEQREYLSMLSEFDVGLISLDRRLKTQNLPGKLLGYMYWGMPILASINPGNDLFDLLGKNKAGLCFVNGDDDAFAGAALLLADNRELRVRMGKESRRLLEQMFSAETAVNNILEHLSNTARPSVRLSEALEENALAQINSRQM